MKIGAITIILSVMINISSTKDIVSQNITGVSLIETSQQLLLGAKTHESTESLEEVIQNSSGKTLMQQLKDDNHKKAFWINIYNAYTQIILSKNPGKYKNRNSFFSARQINIAGNQLSLDDIEHGLLRHSKIKWSLGYLNKWFPTTFEKEQRVDIVDYRIHFTLNCGAKSCPPIAFYKPEQLDKQLDMATKAYLQSEAEYNESKNTVELPAVMGWFRGDFGGKKKMVGLLHRLQIVPEEKRPVIKFKGYSWNLLLENYQSE